MIWKVFMMAKEEGYETVQEVGWTQIDLFSINGDLKRGIWKCPLYELPVDPNITKEAVQQLTPIVGIWFYLRISFPWGDEFTDHPLLPEEGAYMAEIPEMHLRVVTWRPKRDPKPAPIIEPEPVIEPPKIEEKKPEPIIEPPKPLPPKEPEIDPYANDRLGCILDMKRVYKYRTDNSLMKVAVVCLEGNTPINDDTTKKWIRNTLIHYPFAGKTPEEVQLAGGPPIREEYINMEGKTQNLAVGGDVVYKDQKFNLYRNLPVVWTNNRRHWYLLFQLLEKKIKIKEPKKKGKEEPSDDPEEANPLSKIPYVPIGFAVFRLSKLDFTLNEGLHTVKFYKLPIKVPPFDESTVERVDAETELEFKILRSFYDMKDVDREYKAFLKETKKKDNDDRQAVFDPSKADVKVYNEPFIQNTKIQYIDKIFEKGFGVDFYLDACRFLPDNVSITKCLIRVVNDRYKDLFPLKATLPKFNKANDALNPIFEYRTEYRAENFNPTALILIALLTIDTAHNQPRIIGYAAINMFVNRNTNKQPLEESDSDIVLQNGCYQIPIYAEEPLRVEPFDMEKIQKLKVLPGASVLVRLNLAPMSSDFKRVLNKAEVPKEEWKKLGIWPQRPEYSTGAYCTNLCGLKDNETTLLKYRDTRPEVPIQDMANLILRVAGINKDLSEKELFLWLDSQIKINSNTKMIDNKFFARYLEQAGFKFSVDAIHNVPNSNPYVVTYTINPPGDYYKDPLMTQSLILNSNIDWNHPIGQIKFFDDYYYYKGLEFDPYAHIIIEVKEMINKNDEFTFKDYGWTVAPIFIGDGFVINGHYQIPLFEGAFPKELFLEDLKKEKAWDAIQEVFTARKSPLKWINYSSVLIRMIDGQREGQLTTKLDIDSLETRYLPENLEHKTKFAFNEQVWRNLQKNKKLAMTIPNNGRAADYNKQIISACLEHFKLDQYKV
jgi:hypothetical protein